MGRQIGNGADLSAGPVWELGRRKEKKEKKNKKGRDYKDVIFPHLSHRHTNTQWVTHARTLSQSRSPSLSHHLSMICLIPSKTVEVKKPAFRNTALWSSSGCEVQSIRQQERWAFFGSTRTAVGGNAFFLLKQRRVSEGGGWTASGPPGMYVAGSLQKKAE